MSPGPSKSPPLSPLAELLRRSQPLSESSGPSTGTESPLLAALQALANLTAGGPPVPSPPPTIHGRWFKDQTVPIDGYTFERCRFDRCKLLTEFATFTFRQSFISSDCQLLFQGPSLKIVRLLMHQLAMGNRIQKYFGEEAVFPTLHTDGTFTLE